MLLTVGNGTQIHYEVYGDADRPTLVLSHSLGVHLGMWKPQTSALAGRFRLLLYDMRGHGESRGFGAPYGIAELAGDVLHLLDHLDLESASFCGLSMGGVIGQWLGIHASNRLQKLILASTAARIGSEEGWDTRIATVMRDGTAPIIPATIERWFTADFRAAHPDVIKSIEATLQATDPQGYAASCAAMRDADFRATIGEIRTPTLVIAGTYDPATTPEDGRFLAGKIVGSEYVELPAAHLSNIEAAAAFNTALSDFLK